MYEYGSIEDAKAGDVFECIDGFDTRFTENKLYILKDIRNGSAEVTKCDDGYTEDRYSLSNFKLVKTLPGSEAKVGDTVIRFKGGTDTCPTGTIFTVIESDIQSSLGYADGLSAYRNECLVLCKAIPQISYVDEKRNLAFYKRSGKPWTNQECGKIVRYTKDTDAIKEKDWGNLNPTFRYMFDDGRTFRYMANWGQQEKHPNFKNCKQVAYEDVFETPHSEESTATPRVAIVTRHVSGHPVGSRIVPTDASKHNWKLADDSKSLAYCHSIGSSCEWEDGLTTHTDTVTFTRLDETSPATSCSQPTLNPIPEEETMSTNNITIAMTADEYAKYKKANKPTKPKTQLETAPKWFTIWYGVNGNVDCQTTESPKKAKKALQHPSKLGFTFRSYLITESATTDIPVVNIAI